MCLFGFVGKTIFGLYFSRSVFTIFIVGYQNLSMFVIFFIHGMFFRCSWFYSMKVNSAEIG